MRGLIRTTRVGRKLVGLALLAVVSMMVVATGASAATTTLGQTTSSGTFKCGEYWFLQTDSAYVVPAGNWAVTSWSTQAGATGGSMALVIFRSAGSGSYTVVGASPVESPAAGTLNTFTLANPISVQAGDLLGMYENGAFCGSSGVGFVFGGFGPGALTVNATVTPTWGNDSFRANVSATLTSLSAPLPTSKDDCKNGGWQSFGGHFKNQGDCVSFVATGGKNGPAR